MDVPDRKIIENVVTGGIIATLGALIRALMTSKEPVQTKAKNFIAGVCAGMLVSFILRNSQWAQLFKEIFIGICGAFISTYWPLLEFFVKKYLLKKISAVDTIIEKSKDDVANDDCV